MFYKDCNSVYAYFIFIVKLRLRTFIKANDDDDDGIILLV